ncbi:hypothetical protein CFP56_018101 [Quercus suber]|uniref:Uncharacterized protein n=1 Tax=Quercus suber TaxID=58331 RepID=A0AAW0KIR2_QUESU
METVQDFGERRSKILKKEDHILCILSSSMKATHLTLPKLSCLPSSFTTRHQRRLVNLTVAACGGTNRRDYWGRLVDENMIMLRLRIKEMKIMETNY